MTSNNALDKFADSILLAREHTDISPEEIITHKKTGMKSRLKLSDNSHRERVWSQEMLFHYLNMILDRFSDVQGSSIGLFRNSKSYGPKGNVTRVVFHPFKWNGDWHLAIGFSDLQKMLFLNCSGEEFPYERGVGSFSLKAVLAVEDFVHFFGHKISKYALKYPKIYSHVFEPVSSINAVNLLSAVFAFCVDEISVTNTFCDLEDKPRKYDVSVFYPVLKGFDRYAYTRSILGNNFVDGMIEKSQKNESELLDKELGLTQGKAQSILAPSTQKEVLGKYVDDDISTLFSRHAAEQFLNYLVEVDDFYKVPDFLDELVEMFENLSHDSRTNPSLEQSEKHYWEWNLLTRENLYAEYTKKTKMEFNEKSLKATLKAADHRNQVFPLVFENGIVFLVNISTEKNKFDTHVKVVVISNRASTNERAVLKNYALKRLVEMYVWQYKRLVKNIDVSLLILKDHSPYNVLICTLYCLHHFVFNGDFSLDIKPDVATLDNYGIRLQQLMHDIVGNNVSKRNADYKGMIKYLH